MPELPVYFPVRPRFVVSFEETINSSFPKEIEYTHQLDSLRYLLKDFELLFKEIDAYFCILKNAYEEIEKAYGEFVDSDFTNEPDTRIILNAHAGSCRKAYRDLLALLEKMNVDALRCAETIEKKDPNEFQGLRKNLEKSLKVIRATVESANKERYSYVHSTSRLLSFYTSPDCQLYLMAIMTTEEIPFRELDTLKELHHIVQFNKMPSWSFSLSLRDEEMGYRVFALSDIENHPVNGFILKPRKNLIKNILVSFFKYELENAERLEHYFMEVFTHGFASGQWSAVCDFFGFDILQIVDYLKKAAVLHPTEEPSKPSRALDRISTFIPEIVLTEHTEAWPAYHSWRNKEAYDIFYSEDSEVEKAAKAAFEKFQGSLENSDDGEDQSSNLRPL